MAVLKGLGMGGNVTTGGSDYPVTEWNGTLENDAQDVTDTGSAGWQALLAGINKADVTFTAFWGSAAASLAATFGIGTTATLTLNVGAAAYTNHATIAGTFIIKSFAIKNAAKNAIEFTCNASSTGAITVT